MRGVIRGLTTFSRSVITSWKLQRRSPGSYVAASVRLEGMEGLEIGDRVTIRPRTRLRSRGGRVEIGDDVEFAEDCTMSAGRNWTIRIGKGCTFNARCFISGDVTVGAQSIFSANIFVGSTDHLFDVQPELLIREQDAMFDDAWKRNPELVKPISIGEDCWLGWNAVVMKGVRIGRGVVVGANTTVTKDVPPYSVVGGTPARILRRRLNFSAPAMLSADDPSSRPYFYEGFDVLGFPPAASGAAYATRGTSRVILILCGTEAITLELSVSSSQRMDMTVSCNDHSVGTYAIGSGDAVITAPLENVPAASNDPFFAGMCVVAVTTSRTAGERSWGIRGAALL